MREKGFSKIETKNNICINVFCYENGLIFQIYVSEQKFGKSMDLLHVINDDKLYKTNFTKQSIKTKNIFVKVVYNG